MENSTKTLDRFLHYLKIHGAHSAAALAKEFEMTVEGARLQLAKLTGRGLVEQVINPKGVGRPTILYNLTEKGNRRFPDGHAELTVQILNTVQTVLGQNALDAVINSRAVSADIRYAAIIKGAKSLEEKLQRLSHIRTEEGYLAEWNKAGDDYLFIENHCPIGTAAKHCRGFCQSELNTLTNLLGPGVEVSRTEYLLDNDRRCAYRIRILDTV